MVINENILIVQGGLLNMQSGAYDLSVQNGGNQLLPKLVGTAHPTFFPPHDCYMVGTSYYDLSAAASHSNCFLVGEGDRQSFIVICLVACTAKGGTGTYGASPLLASGTTSRRLARPTPET